MLKLAYIDENADLDPAVDGFIAEVAAESRGALTIRFVGDCCGRENDAQRRAVAGVAKDRWDLGWVPTRDLADMGAPTIGALTAPRLVDSYAAEAAVLGSDIPAELLPGLGQLGVRGLAIEPGTLRRPISAGRPLREPKDWTGRTFWTYRSAVSASTIAALGAKVSQVGNDVRDTGFEDGTITAAENSVVWQTASDHVPNAVVTINLALWPRTSALFASPRLQLSKDERRWLLRAASTVAKRTAAPKELDASSVNEFCVRGYRLATASPQQLRAVDRAIAPVIAKLERAAATKAVMDRIRALKPSVPPSEYAVPAYCRAR